MPTPSWLSQCAPRTAPRALAWYLLLSLVFTWPLASGFTHDLPRDLGDSLLNCWILGWNASHFLEALRGNVATLNGLWHGNIFHPEPYTLAYSELLLAPSLQILPVYALTGNLILCYNLLYLSTYVLSGLGLFLLARAYTSDWRAAFVAGLLFAFTPYRVNQGPHIQVMSSQWMPFVLYGFHRFVETRRFSAVLGGAAALVAQNLSCGYFMIFFAPFVPAFVLFEIARRHAWKDPRVWIGFGLAAVLVAAATLPIMEPYAALRELRGSRRSLDEILFYSADAWGWLSADDQLAFWGPRLRLWVKPEGQLFPGLIPVVLAIIGAAAGARSAWRSTSLRRTGSALVHLPPRARRTVVWVFSVTAVIAVTGAALAVTGIAGEFFGWIRTPFVRLENHLIALAVIAVAAVLLSPRARTFGAIALASPLAFAMAAAVVAWYLSLGPAPRAGGHLIHGPRLYLFLLEGLPGLDGLRVAARFAMLVVFFLSWAAAWGVRRLLLARTSVPAGALLAVTCILWMGETWNAPLPVNGIIGSAVDGIGDPPARVPTGPAGPPLARYLRQLPADAVVIEFPFGAGGWEMRYVYYSTLHWRRIVNGFSGFSPESYDDRVKALRDPYRDPDEAWRELLNSGATHIVVHGQAFLSRERPAPYGWLDERGARFVAQFGTDDVYEVPR